jgi:predicted RecA/RadA family phage recombinase
MSQFRSLTIQSGAPKEIQNGNVLIVGSGIDAGSAGALKLGDGTATEVVSSVKLVPTGNQSEDLGDSTRSWADAWVAQIRHSSLGIRPPQVIKMTNNSGGTILAGEVVYVSGPYEVSKSKADNSQTARMFAVCMSDVSTGNDGYFYRDGTIPIPSARQGGGTWTAGDQVWISTSTSGGITNTQPTGSGNFEVVVGWVLNTPGGGTAYVDLNRGDFVKAL